LSKQKTNKQTKKFNNHEIQIEEDPNVLLSTRGDISLEYAKRYESHFEV